MIEETRQIGLRIKGLRDALDLSQEHVAKACGMSVEEYRACEAGAKDFSISLLKRIADQYEVDINTLMFDEESHMSSYALTRRGKGLEVKRQADNRYQTLTTGFSHRKADVFYITVEPKPDDTPVHLSQHAGQEFNLVIKGRLLIRVGGKDLILERGDSLYFDPSKPHGLKALDGKTAKLIAVII